MTTRSPWYLLVSALALYACSSPSGSGPVSTTAATAAPAPSTSVQAPVSTDVAEPPRVLLVGDSTLLAVESYNAVEGLEGFEADLEVASCRTLGIPSCGDPPVPPNAVDVISSAQGPYDVVVVMAGYDEWWTSFPESLREVGDAARTQGAETLLFLTFREGVGYIDPAGRTATEAFVRNNETLRAVEASGEIPELVVADWYGYTSGSAAFQWLTSDGIHLTQLGAFAVGDYISRWVAHVLRAGVPRRTRPRRAVPEPGRSGRPAVAVNEVRPGSCSSAPARLPTSFGPVW